MATPHSCHGSKVRLSWQQHHTQTPPRPYYAGAIKLRKMSFRGTRQCEAFWPLGLLTSGCPLIYGFCLHPGVPLRNFVPSTMRTCALTMCALFLALVCSGVPLVCVGLPPSLRLTSPIAVSPPPWPLLSQRPEAPL